MFVDLLIVRYLHIISRNHSNTFLLIKLPKTKTCQKKPLQQSYDIRILTVQTGFCPLLNVYFNNMNIKARSYIYQVVSRELPFAATCSEK